jgi:hypothetical protein
MRVTRVALQELGLSPDLQRHGIERQVYALPLANNFRDFLTQQAAEADLARPPLAEIAAAAIARWVIPRAARDQRYRDTRVSDLERIVRNEEPGLNGSG